MRQWLHGFCALVSAVFWVCFVYIFVTVRSSLSFLGCSFLYWIFLTPSCVGISIVVKWLFPVILICRDNMSHQYSSADWMITKYETSLACIPLLVLTHRRFHFFLLVMSKGFIVGFRLFLFFHFSSWQDVLPIQRTGLEERRNEWSFTCIPLLHSCSSSLLILFSSSFRPIASSVDDSLCASFLLHDSIFYVTLEHK